MRKISKTRNQLRNQLSKYVFFGTRRSKPNFRYSVRCFNSIYSSSCSFSFSFSCCSRSQLLYGSSALGGSLCNRFTSIPRLTSPVGIHIVLRGFTSILLGGGPDDEEDTSSSSFDSSFFDEEDDDEELDEDFEFDFLSPLSLSLLTISSLSSSLLLVTSGLNHVNRRRLFISSSTKYIAESSLALSFVSWGSSDLSLEASL